nr:hypothetical protein B0A51_14013 [Rachicladosporium sp. CCFEE 5018]
MRLIATLTLFVKTAVSAATVSYDAGYDNPFRSLAVTSCSNGVNGLITKHGWQNQGDIPRFPHIGG